MIEDKFPEKFKRAAYHPSAFVYGFRKAELEKLFEELMTSNIAIKSGEVWVVNEGRVEMVVPMKEGQLEVFSWKIDQEKDEQWYDFVERSTKQSLAKIGEWNLEKTSRVDLNNKIWYHFEFLEQPHPSI